MRVFFALSISVLLSPNLYGSIVLPHTREERNFEYSPYPIVQAREQGSLKVSDLHSLFYATYGNPNGTPVVILHGGPGGWCDDTMAKFFDPGKWNVIMFDQRGAMKSLPFGCMEENTPQHSVSDIEKLKNHLGIEKWVVFGGSWGSTLAMLYGQEHPDSCLGFILRGVWLAREQDYSHILYGMGRIFPEAYEPVIQHIPENERGDLLSAYHRRIFDPDPEVQLTSARVFMKFDAICLTHRPDSALVEEMMQSDQIILSVTRAFFHYAKNNFFLEPNQILSRMQKIAHIPAILVQGRYDVVCPPDIAYSVYRNWSNSTLWMIPDGGHSDDELPVAAALIEATNLFAQKLTCEDVPNQNQPFVSAHGGPLSLGRFSQ